MLVQCEGQICRHTRSQYKQKVIAFLLPKKKKKTKKEKWMLMYKIKTKRNIRYPHRN